MVSTGTPARIKVERWVSIFEVESPNASLPGWYWRYESAKQAYGPFPSREKAAVAAIDGKTLGHN